MPGAGNTAVCLRLRCVPGSGKPGAAPRQHRLTYHHRAAAARRATPLLPTRRCDSLIHAASSHRPYACSVPATPMRVFVHDVSPGFANPARRLVHIIYYPAPLRPDYRRTLAPAAPRRLPRHRQPRLDIDHGAPRTATSTTATPPYALGYLDFGTKGLPPAWEPHRLPLQPQLPRCVDRYDCGGDVRRLRLRILLQSHRLRRYVVTAGGC